MDQENNNTKKKQWKQLKEKERYKIEALSKHGLSATEIANELQRHRRTIEREIERGTVVMLNTDFIKYKVYCADTAQQVHEERSRNKGRGFKIGYDHELVRYIEEKISKEKYSPDAVIGGIKANKLEFQTSICTKTLYNMIDKEIFLNISNKNLPVKKNKKKNPKKKVRKVSWKNPTARRIDERPTEIESRETFGHWEMDLVIGKTQACLLVMTERKTRLELIYKLPSKEQRHVIRVLDKLERKYGKRFVNIFKSITTDNGGEFLDSVSMERSCKNPSNKRLTCYYAHPYSSWERGSNEVNNKLIRYFVPKGSDLSKLTTRDINRIEAWMNNYPRRMFGYKSSNNIYDKLRIAETKKEVA